LSEATGLAYSTVWAIWTNKTRRADLDTLEKIAAALKVEPGDLIGRAKPEQE
jgi:DNA-binding Xre family transcriptional regulator